MVLGPGHWQAFSGGLRLWVRIVSVPQVSHPGFSDAVHAARMGDCSEAPGRCTASLTWTCHSGSNAFRGVEEGRPPGPRDPLAHGVRSGILNVALWGSGDESRREGRAAAHLRSFRLLALIAGRCGPRPGLGVRGPGHGRGCLLRRAARGRAGRHLHDATETRTVPQSVCGRQDPPLRGAHVRHSRAGCRDL